MMCARQTRNLSHACACNCTRKCDVWGVVFTHPVGCSRLLSTLNDLTATNWKNLESRRVWGCVRKRHNGSPLSALYMSSVADFTVNCHELHQESFHCHQDVLDEEDDGCHCWYCQKGIGASCSFPHSWWRRCNLVNASLKSERSFIGPIFPDILRETHHFFLYRKYSSSFIR